MKALRDALNASLIEREAEIDAILLGLLSREHVLLTGDPGTAKSLLCRSVKDGIEGMQHFEVLLGPSMDPNDVFGPIDPIKSREEGRYLRKSAKYLGGADIAFFDEVFRANDAVLDMLLHALGPERQTLVEGEQMDLPLTAAVGATNMYPDSAHQAAIFDRWLIRRDVKPVSPRNRRRLMFDKLPEVKPVMDMPMFRQYQKDVDGVNFPDDVKDTLLGIVDELFAAGIRLSDRRLRKSESIARAAAVLDGCSEVQVKHLEPLGDVLWDDPREQPDKAREIVSRIANPVGARLNEILRAVDEILVNAVETDQKLAAIKKLEEAEKELTNIKAAGGNGRADKCLSHVKRERVRMQVSAMGLDPAKAEKMMEAML